jgi:hypothetical protein
MVSGRQAGPVADFCITFSAYLFLLQLKIVRELREDAGGKGLEIA